MHFDFRKPRTVKFHAGQAWATFSYKIVAYTSIYSAFKFLLKLNLPEEKKLYDVLIDREAINQMFIVCVWKSINLKCITYILSYLNLC